LIAPLRGFFLLHVTLLFSRLVVHGYVSSENLSEHINRKIKNENRIIEV
jgi:hypothetical protein